MWRREVGRHAHRRRRMLQGTVAGSMSKGAGLAVQARASCPHPSQAAPFTPPPPPLPPLVKVCRHWRSVLDSPAALQALWEELTVDFGHELITGRSWQSLCKGPTPPHCKGRRCAARDRQDFTDQPMVQSLGHFRLAL